ncbi:hypothetical protein [Basilea psittacipulmonis]|uniref:hypothetical protein n=1 Tax=Basilea psittacipulmonis TaxID=1472345 RepID=UPI0005713F6C|nr:hypothetical protein [Basilea psittacipulmonis]
MKKLVIIVISFLLTGCFPFLYREPFEIYSYASWVDAETEEEVTNEDFRFCDDKAIFEVMGIVVDTEEVIRTGNFDKTYPPLGKCLYEMGYVYKVKHPILYCANRPEICKAYRDYIRRDFFSE